MSNLSKPTFKPIGFGAVKSPPPDVDKLLKTVSVVAKETNTPKLVHPNDPKPAPVEVKPPAQPATRNRRLVVELPDYLVDDIERRSIGGKTRRYLTMKAFQAAGYHIDENDLKEDNRGGRRS